MCPKCNKDYLIPLHKKRKDNDDFQCPNCNGQLGRSGCVKCTPNVRQKI